VSVDRSLDVSYPVTYYGDGTEADSASPIAIHGGERIEADIHLVPVHALSLRFRVPENEQNGFRVPQLQQSGLEGSTTSIQGTGISRVSPGIMEITGIPAGKYTVRIEGEAGTTQINGLDLAKEGQEVDLSNAEPLSHVKVAVSFPGGAETHRGASVALISGRSALAGWHQVSPKGEAEFEQIPAGVY